VGGCVLRELAQGVYVETGYEGGNVGLVVRERAALLIDTPMLPPEARRWQLALLQMGVTDLYGIVNTDYHPEHFLGNALFMPIRTFGHELSEKPLARYETSTLDQVAVAHRDRDPALAAEIMRIPVAPPEVQVEDRLTLYIGGPPIQVLHLDGHTPASLGVYLPEERVLFAGDNVTNHEHPALFQANSLAWLATLERIQAMNIEVIVPGDSEPCGKEAIEPLYGYIAEMRRRTQELFDRGASRRECVDKVGMLDWFPVPERRSAEIKRRRRASVERVYTEIRVASRKR